MIYYEYHTRLFLCNLFMSKYKEESCTNLTVTDQWICTLQTYPINTAHLNILDITQYPENTHVSSLPSSMLFFFSRVQSIKSIPNNS